MEPMAMAKSLYRYTHSVCSWVAELATDIIVHVVSFIM